jgi:hypothetical protein
MTSQEDPIKKKKSPIEANPPRGSRGNFLQITAQMSVEMLSELRAAGLRRRAKGMIDTDVSSLIREAVTAWLIEEEARNTQ